MGLFKKLMPAFVGLALVLPISLVSAQRAMDAKTSMGGDTFQFIKDDHNKVKSMFNEIISKGVRSDALLSQIQSALQKHMRAEETYLYPAMKKESGEDINVDEYYAEHRKAMDVINEAKNERDDARWMDKVKEVRDAINDHIQKEEEQLLIKAKNSMDPMKAEEVARNMKNVMTR